MTEERLKNLEIHSAVAQQRYETLVDKIDDMPANIVNQVRLIMIEESRKTADGLGQEVTKLKANQKWIIVIGTAISSLIAKLLNLH